MELNIGYRVPRARIATVGGTSRAIKDYRGRLTLIYGWGSWHASREKLIDLQKIHAEYPDVAVLSISFDAQGPVYAMKHLKAAGATYELLIDATCTLSRRWNIRTLPFVALLDADGYLQYQGDSLEDAVSLLSAGTFEQAGELKEERGSGHAKLDILVQGCAIYMSRNLKKKAADSLREALKMDPGNKIIEEQIGYVEGGA